jgi:hypothetical protein
MRETSLDAYRSVKPAITSLQSLVLSTLREAGEKGLTDEELTDRHSDENRSTYRTRRAELVRRGLVRATGQKRRLRNGRQGRVWIAA